MRRLAAFAALSFILGMTGIAFAGAQVPLKDSEEAQHAAARKKYYDHPMTQVVQSKDVKVVITTDSIMRSCCMPPNLVVAGDVTNTGTHPVDYVRMLFSFEDADGKVVHAETIYNLKAASLGQDDEIARILREKPHFVPIPPGSTDHFSFSVPTPLLPRFAKVELFPEPAVQ